MLNLITAITEGDGGIYFVTETKKYWACFDNSVEAIIAELGLTKNVKLDFSLCNPLANTILKHVNQ